MSPIRFVWIPVVLAAGFAVAIPSPLRAGDQPASPTAVPAATKVLILPTLDNTGDKPNMVVAHIAQGNHRAEYEFLTRGFAVIGPTDAIAEAQKEGIDLTDSDSRSKQNLTSIGRALGATWVVSVSLDDVREVKVVTLFSAVGRERRAKAKVHIRVVDLTSGQYIFNGNHEDTKTTQRFGGALINGIGTTGLFHDAIDTCIQRGFEPVVAQYPQTKPIDDQFGMADLVTGVDPTKSAPAAPAPVAANAGQPTGN